MKKKDINIDYLAKLGNLPLSKEERKIFKKQIADSLDQVEAIKKIKVDKTRPLFQVTRLENIYHEDILKEGLMQEQALASAPKKKNGYFLTSRIKWE
ncbi:MAG: Asp-tRNA(Asn)/Glu-tRNA(Gln) amidotransferase subunit GatC [Candidatus Shapirobacteria bacterium]